jgi:ribonuclease HI
MFKTYYTDGSGWNGKEAEYAVATDTGHILLRETFHEPFTNNDMEFEGVICALKICNEGDTIYSDSNLVVNSLDTEKQLKKPWNITKPNLIPRHKECLEILSIKKVHIIWKRRNYNLAGKIFE